jgi:hypothetical protein
LISGTFLAAGEIIREGAPWVLSVTERVCGHRQQLVLHLVWLETLPVPLTAVQ